MLVSVAHQRYVNKNNVFKKVFRRFSSGTGMRNNSKEKLIVQEFKKKKKKL